MKALFGKLALSAGMTVIVLLALELVVRFLDPQDLDFYNGEKILRRSTRPGLQVELIPNSANDSYVGVPVRINSMGLRDRELTVPKPERTFRVLALGDSVTFGFGVRVEETYVKRLESRLNRDRARPARRAEVVNAGIEGVGLDYYFHFLRTRGVELEPDLVLVGIVLNDIADYEPGDQAGRPRRSPVVSALQAFNRTMRVRSHLYASVSARMKSFLYRVGALDVNRLYADNFLALGPPSELQRRAWASTLAVLDDLVELAERRGIPVVLVVFPMEMQLSAGARDLYRQALGVRLDDAALSDDPQKRLVEFSRSRGVPLVDLLPAFRRHQSNGLFLRGRSISHDWAHPSPEGHDVAADEIFRALRHLGLVPAEKKG